MNDDEKIFYDKINKKIIYFNNKLNKLYINNYIIYNILYFNYIFNN